MDDKKQSLVASIVTGIAILVLAGVILLQGKPQVSVTVAPQGTPVVVSGQGSNQTFGGTSADQTTNWTGGNFSGDLTVSGTSTLTGTLTTGGTLQLGGTLLSPLGDYGVFHTSSTMLAATTTPCAFQNLSGRTRTLTAVSYVFTSSTPTGVFTITAGTSTGSGTTSTSPLVSAQFITIAGKDAINTTSSLQTVYAPWQNNEWFTYKSTTTTNVGFCRILFY